MEIINLITAIEIPLALRTIITGGLFCYLYLLYQEHKQKKNEEKEKY